MTVEVEGGILLQKNCNKLITWEQYYEFYEKREAEGVERNAGNWPTFFLKRNNKGKFIDRKGRVFVWNVMSPTKIDFKGKELNIVRETLKNLTEEQRQIAKFYSEGPPTKQWTPLIDNLIDTYELSPPMAARLLASVQMGISDTLVVVWYYKYRWNVPRPIHFDPNLRTVICTPEFPAYVSGHASVSGCAETILSYFFPHESKKLNKFAEEDAKSRLYAGVHFEIDNNEGLKLGRQIGEYIVSRLKAQNIKGDVHKKDLNAQIFPPSYKQVISFSYPNRCRSVLERHLQE
jgi:PAP2 superfamily